MNKKCISPQALLIVAEKKDMSGNYWNKYKGSCDSIYLNFLLLAYPTSYVESFGYLTALQTHAIDCTLLSKPILPIFF